MKLKYWIFCLLPIFAFCEQKDTIPTLPPKDATQSARTCQDLKGAFVTADFIYWKARQLDMVYCAKVDFTFDLPNIGITFKGYEIDFEYKPGFRLGIGGDLPWDGWDVCLNWTRFSFEINSSKRSNSRDLILVDGSIEGFDFLGDYGRIHWDFSYNSLDFDWGRRLFLSSSLIIRPSFGLKTVWIDNDVKLTMDNVVSFNPFGSGLPGLQERTNRDFDIWGIGPQAAFYGKWNWVYGLGLAGQVSTSLLWYHVDEAVSSVLNQLQDQDVGQLNLATKFKTHLVRPYLQLFVGLDWEWCFIPKWLSAQLSLGYEAQYFWSMVDNPVGSDDNIPLTFEGLTIKARIDF